VIFIDGLKENFSEADKINRGEVIKIAESEKWCKNVRIHISGKNKGLSKSVTEGVAKILEEYDKVIVLEDDLDCDKYFLSFMNRALDLYESNEEVACVSGYIYPVKEKLPQSFFIKGADCWGWGTWKRAWSIYNNNGKELLEQLAEKKLQKEFDFNNSYPYTQMLSDQVAGKNSSWAVRWYASAFLQNKLCLYPGNSLIRNTGNDGSGTHSEATEKFDNPLQNIPVHLKKIETVVSEEAYRAVTNFFLDAGLKNVSEKNNGSFLKKIYRKLLPSGLRTWLYEKRNPATQNESGWSGDYHSWEEVKRKCSGYDSSLIFEKVKEATLQVKSGKAVFERDSVLFYEPEYNEDFVNTMTSIADQNKNQLNVLDFGGAMGSVYYQYKSRFADYKINWNVVEQEHFVEFGKKELENDELKFYFTIEECLKDKKIDVIILSSVISYMEKPYELLEKILKFNFGHVLIDRTIFKEEKNDLLTKQTVPANIYNASYPCWILDKNKLVTFMLNGYSLVNEFDPYHIGNVKIDDKTAFFRALVFKIK